MNSKSLAKRLQKMNYTLTREHYGWLIRSTLTGFVWSMPNLEAVHTFTIDEENLSKYAAR